MQLPLQTISFLDKTFYDDSILKKRLDTMTVRFKKISARQLISREKSNVMLPTDIAFLIKQLFYEDFN